VTKIVAFCCDAGRGNGVGHVMRCIALAEEFAARGYEPVFASDLGGIGWLEDELRRRDFPVIVSANVALEPMLGLSPMAIVVDTYGPMRFESYASVPASAQPVLVIHDGPYGMRDGDILLDQNLGAYGPGLNGLRYALLRDDIVRLRPDRPRAGRHGVPPKVLAFFGGTDPFGAGPAMARALVATELEFAATVVAADGFAADQIGRIQVRPGQSITTIPPGAGLMAHITDADLVVAASGTTLWELLCVGAAAAVINVVPNQDIGYRKVIATGVAAGLGSIVDMVMDPAPVVAALKAILLDGDERDRLRADGWNLVDGLGKQRVADALLDLV
jgi:spore coat polysaccharide biosynthesis predicted glycosyltransferase SpsG